MLADLSMNARVALRAVWPISSNSYAARLSASAWRLRQLIGSHARVRTPIETRDPDPTSLRLVAGLLFCAPAATAVTARERSSPAYAPARAAGTLRGRWRAGRSRRPARQACL